MVVAKHWWSILGFDRVDELFKMLNLSLELGMFVLEILEIDHGVFEVNIHDTLEMLLELVKLLDDIPIDVRAVVDHLLHHSVGFSKLIVVSFELVHLLLELEEVLPPDGLLIWDGESSF